ncbi:MAG: Lrp/AsnC family transcriptional regulator [Hahellaceae bacterium]|nr:Lrp/AsnC family transcriptional regulator [Hahellaceae bacterium]MCP5212571.1 Lrp/AsnC family transcriptional regulator [Hahellaceae bacterium]
MELSSLEMRLIDTYQRGFPFCEKPFAAVGELMGASEQEVIEAVLHLQEVGVLSRLGPVFDHKKAGASTLAAVAVPESDIDAVAATISQFPEVNHNYAREHEYNIWFVVTTSDQEQLEATLDRIEIACGYPVMSLPMIHSFHIDLGFQVDWSHAHGRVE